LVDKASPLIILSLVSEGGTEFGTIFYQSTKNNYMKKVTKLLTFSMCLLFLTALFSCKKDSNKNGGPYSVEYKVTTSSNATISSVVHTNAQGDATSLTSVAGNSWSTKVTVQAGVSAISLGANGGATDASGTIKVQILIDGKVVKENTGSGTALTATTVYMTN
jgi:preprotein translocase subunit SecG